MSLPPCPLKSTLLRMATEVAAERGRSLASVPLLFPLWWCPRPWCRGSEGGCGRRAIEKEPDSEGIKSEGIYVPGEKR